MTHELVLYKLFTFFFFPVVGEVENVGQFCAEIEGLSASSVSPRILIDHLEEGGAGESPIRSTDSPSKRKGTSISNSTKDFLVLKHFYMLHYHADV